MPIFPSPAVEGLTVVAIDPGKHLGWAVQAADGAFRHGADNLPTDMKWRALRGLLNRLAANHGPVHAVWIEKSIWKRQAYAMLDHGGFLAITEDWCQVNRARFEWAAPSSIKSHITGSGRAKKADVMHHVQMVHGVKTKSDDEADAIALLDYALAQMALRDRLRRAG
jgi:Holliday junction resolvasome RuvABC endonuclease subunit